MSEMKDKMQIKVCSGEASTKNEQSKNAEGKNAQNKNGEKSVTVRVQKIKKNHIKQKLIFFLILAIGLVIVALFSERLCPYDPYAQDLSSALQPPSMAHPMGTDTYGRDMLSRVISGARASIFSTFILVAVISIFGTAVGVCCGYLWWNHWIRVMMRISDVCLAFPGLVFAMAIAAILGGGIQNAIIALAVISWPKYSRIARSQTLALKNEPYIHAAILAGDSSWSDYAKTYSSQYDGTGSGNCHAGYRNHDDGAGRTFLSGTGSADSDGRVGKYDEQRHEV